MFKISKKTMALGCSILLSSSLLTGCHDRASNQTTVSQTTASRTAAVSNPVQNASRPIISLVPVVDHTRNDLPWSLSEELTAAIHYRLEQKGNVYLSDQQKTDAVVRKLSKSHHPFSDNLSWVKKFFSTSEFVVFMELIEHEETPIRSAKHAATASLDSPAELKMSLRVRVVDVRGPEVAIVLQEMIHDTHHIPKQFTKANFHQIPWGKDSFNISPMGLAHAQLVKEVTGRVEDYVLLAKNRIESAAQTPKQAH